MPSTNAMNLTIRRTLPCLLRSFVSSCIVSRYRLLVSTVEQAMSVVDQFWSDAMVRPSQGLFNTANSIYIQKTALCK